MHSNIKKATPHDEKKKRACALFSALPSLLTESIQPL